MTSSARASSLSGTSTPIAFADLRLITSSNLVGCSTGSSAGFVPLRIMSTYSAARRYICRRSTPYAINPRASGNALLPYTTGSRVVMARSAICRRVLASNASSRVMRPAAPTVGGGIHTGHNLIGVSCFEHLDRLRGLRSRRVELAQRLRRERRIRIHQHCDSSFAWDELMQDLESLAHYIACFRCDTGDVSAWPTQAIDQSSSNGIANTRKYNRYRAGCGLCCLCGECSESSNQHVWSGIDQLCGQ